MSGERLLELAARCEQASGADREIVEAAYTAINGVSVAAVIYRHGSLGEDPDYEKGAAARRFAELVNAQAWLDAAMMLAGGFGGQVTFFKGGAAKAFLWQPYPTAIECKAATPALALIAVCLRAMAAS